jgi:phospholipid/cholesterol/gamma-HCH transport system substrate-binding protein
VNTEAKVGTFVLLCLAVLCGTVYYVGNEAWGRHLTPYKTYLRYAGGIEAGSEVLFGGISVGKVTAVRAWDRDPTQIEIRFEVKENTPLNAKCVAKLGSVSLMSSPALSITTGSQDAPRLKAGATIASLETVSLDDMTRKISAIADSAQGLITEVRGDLNDISGRAETLLANLNDVTGPTNRKHIAEILQEVNGLIAKQSPKLDQIADQVLLITQDTDSAVKKVGPLLDHADATIGTVNSTVANVSTTIDQLRDPMRDDLLQLHATLQQAQSVMASVDGIVKGNQDNIQETIENLRVATENLDHLTDQIKQNPWSLVRIRQPKDRKVPQ